MSRRKTIVVSAYLCGSGQEKKVSYFEGLDRVLRARGLKFFLVNVGPDPFESSVEHVTMPFCVTAANKIRGDAYLAEDGLSPALREAAGIESAIRNSPLLTAAVKVLFFQKFMRRVLKRRKPALCVIWHQFNGLHRGLAELCDHLNIPVVYAEYGSLPGTVVFEAEGQMAESWVVQRHAEFMDLPVADEDVARAQKLLSHVRAGKRSRKVQSGDLSVADVVESNRALGRKIIFYAGQNDPQTGMVPSWLPKAKVHSPIYENTEDSVRHLVELAEKKDWHVLYKPHPMLEAKQKSFDVRHPNRLDFVSGADIFECMEKSDLTVTILSQVSYMALVHGRACVLLGRNQLSGKESVYEPADRDDVERTVSQALESGVTEEQRKNWLRHVTQMCKYYLFSFEEEVAGLIGRDVDECADFLQTEILCGLEGLIDRRKSKRFVRFKTGGHQRLSGLGKLHALYMFLKFFDASLRQLPEDEARRPGRVVKQFVRKFTFGT